MGKRVIVKRDPIAKDLGTTKYHLRVVKSTKVYTRKVKHRQVLRVQASREAS